MIALPSRGFVSLNPLRITVELVGPSTPFCWSSSMPLAAAANAAAGRSRRSGLTDSRQLGTSVAARRPARTGNVVRLDMNLPRAAAPPGLSVKARFRPEGASPPRAPRALLAPLHCGACAAGHVQQVWRRSVTAGELLEVAGEVERFQLARDDVGDPILHPTLPMRMATGQRARRDCCGTRHAAASSATRPSTGSWPWCFTNARVADQVRM